MKLGPFPQFTTKAYVAQISCGENQHDWFAIETTWCLTVDPFKVDDATWRYKILLAFTTRLAPWYHNKNPWLKGAALEEHLRNPPAQDRAPLPWVPLHGAAFRHKKFAITLSRGRFIEPWHYFIKSPFPLFQFKNFGSKRFAPNRYASQVTFDVSPYPPREEWDDTLASGSLAHSLEFHRHWEKITFVRDAIAKKDHTWAETLDLGWWLSPRSGEAYERGWT